MRPATQLLPLRLVATVVERSQNRIRGSDRAHASFGRDEFILHSPVSRDESQCVGQDSTAHGDELRRFPVLRSHPDLAEAVAAVVVPADTRL